MASEKIEINLDDDVHDDLIRMYVEQYMLPESKQVFEDYLKTHMVIYALERAVINEMANRALAEMLPKEDK